MPDLTDADLDAIEREAAPSSVDVATLLAEVRRLRAPLTDDDLDAVNPDQFAMAAEIRTLRADLADRESRAAAEFERMRVERDDLRERLANARIDFDDCNAASLAALNEKADEIDVLRADLAARDNLIADLRCCLAAARLDAANARSVASDAIDNLRHLDGCALFYDDDRGRCGDCDCDVSTLRARLSTPADHAARVTAAVDRLVEASTRDGYANGSDPTGGGKVDAARAEVLAAVGVPT